MRICDHAWVWLESWSLVLLSKTRTRRVVEEIMLLEKVVMGLNPGRSWGQESKMVDVWVMLEEGMIFNFILTFLPNSALTPAVIQLVGCQSIQVSICTSIMLSKMQGI